MAYNESDHVKEIDHLKSKLENNYLEELEALKRAHLNALEEAERENGRLRDNLQERNREIEQISSKSSKQKQSLDDNILFLKKDNETLKNRIVEIEQIGHIEITNLQ